MFCYIGEMEDAFLTVRAAGRAEVKVLGSRFLAVAAPVSDRAGAEEVVERERKEHFAASHHCFAWRLGRGGEFRAADAGEPAGSAGKPILAAIDRVGVTNTVVVVTRYFGGTKLGIGGLVRSYGEAASLALEAAGRVEVIDQERLCVTIPHEQIGTIHHAVALVGGRIVESEYGEHVRLTLEVRASLAGSLRSSLVERTAGRVRFEP
jgi:uncharacterized YigZ family protein